MGMAPALIFAISQAWWDGSGTAYGGRCWTSRGSRTSAAPRASGIA
jgi:hypothetical protein